LIEEMEEEMPGNAGRGTEKKEQLQMDRTLRNQVVNNFYLFLEKRAKTKNLDTPHYCIIRKSF